LREGPNVIVGDDRGQFYLVAYAVGLISGAVLGGMASLGMLAGLPGHWLRLLDNRIFILVPIGALLGGVLGVLWLRRRYRRRVGASP
jgi:hypothetical protein